VRTVVDVDVYDRNARGSILSVLPLRHGAVVRIPTAGYDRVGLQRVIPPRRATVVVPRVCLWYEDTAALVSCLLGSTRNRHIV
jgi:hypothetical protein